MLLRISCTHISLPDLGGSKTKVQAGLAYMTKDTRKTFNDHLDAKLDSHTPLYLRSAGKRWEKCTAKVVFALVALAMSVIECLHSSTCTCMLKGSMKQHNTFHTECTAIELYTRCYQHPVHYSRSISLFCQLTVNKKGAWLSNLMSRWLFNHFRESMYRQLIALEWLTYY